MPIERLLRAPDDSDYVTINSADLSWESALLPHLQHQAKICITELFLSEVEDLVKGGLIGNYQISVVPTRSLAHLVVGGGGNGAIVRAYLTPIVPTAKNTGAPVVS